MLEKIRTRSLGRDFAEVEDELILYETPRTRIVFKASIHSDGIRGDIIRYKKDDTGCCEDIVPVNFNSLHPNEGIKINLPTDAIHTLYKRIQELDRLLQEQGVQYGKRDFAIVDSDALIINEDNKAAVIKRLLEANYGEDVWEQLGHDNPDIASRLAYAKVQEERADALKQFEKMLENDELEENDWQYFFENNTWIFGYGLRYQFLTVAQAQPNYGGSDVTGKGGQRGDFLTTSEAEVKYTCLVEIKKPVTKLLQNSQYRSGAWGVSNELSGAVAQIQVNCGQWEMKGAREERNREKLESINTVSPKGIVIVGNTRELTSWDKVNSFERFRQGLTNPEIITYDELLERARFIVGEIINEDVEDVPF